MGFDQCQRGQPLSMTRGPRRHRIDDQSVTVLHQRMTHEDEPRLFARSLAEQPRVGIGRRGMGVILAALAAKIALAVAPRTRRIARTILGSEALGTGPGL